VQREIASKCFDRAAKPALAGLLALLLLVLTTISACPSLHKFLHSDGGETNHQCLVCSFAKGQVAAAEVSGIFASVVIGLVGLVLLPKLSPLPSFDFSLSPSRAPPRR
jgi:hypothetical protein